MDWSWKSSCHTASRLRVDEAVAPKLRSIHATLQPWNTFEGALQSLASSTAGSFCRAALSEPTWIPAKSAAAAKLRKRSRRGPASK